MNATYRFSLRNLSIQLMFEAPREQVRIGGAWWSLTIRHPALTSLQI